MKSVIIYTRVSTKEQATEGVSLDAQLSRARAWATAQGYSIAGEYQDAGLSGRRMNNRPQLQAALNHVCKLKGVLVIYSISRMARSTKDAASIGDRLHRAGADLASLTESFDTSTASGKFFFTILSALGELESDLISERTTTALHHKRSQGFKLGGMVPFGYDVAEDGKLLHNEEEQSTIELAKAMRSEGKTFQAIADALMAGGIKTKQGGERWHVQSVKNMVNRAA